jgi:integrase
MGLVLRMTPTGAATWSVRTRTADGKQTRPKLGTWPAMGIAEARKEALAALSAVQRGADPVREKRKARETRKAQASEPTVAERLAAWQAICAARPKAPWSLRYAGEVKRIAEADIGPRLGKKKLADTTRADWTGLVAAKRKVSPAMASALYRVVSSFLNHAEAEGWIPAALLPRRGAAKLAPAPAPRERVLSDEELAAIWKAADREPPKLRAFVRLLILTGAREMEVADLAAGELDLAAGRWAIPATRTKNGAGYVVPLSPLALAELRAVWPIEGQPGADDLLLGRTPRNGFRGFSKLKDRMDKAAKVAGWRWHDLRRTARTGMTRLGVPRDHAEAAINHVSGRSKLERTYDRHDYAPEVIAALTLWQGHVAGLVGQGAEVVSLADRRRA